MKNQLSVKLCNLHKAEMCNRLNENEEKENGKLSVFCYQKIINELSDFVCHRLGFIRFINFLRNHTLNGWIIFMGQLKVFGCNLAKKFLWPFVSSANLTC